MRSRALLILSALLAASICAAQPATPEQRKGVTPQPDFATLHFETRLGSFRLIDGTGRVEISFTGTMLLSQINGTAEPSGALRKEYDKDGRTIYTGTGRMVVTGTWRAIQWFGRDMRATWYGKGVARVIGEWDTNLNTGEYWFEDPTRKFTWNPLQARDISLPTVFAGQKVDVKPQPRPSGGK